MATQKITVTLDAAVLSVARENAAGRGLSFSEWLTDAARVKLRAEGARAMGEFLCTADGVELSEQMRYASGRRAGALHDTEAA